MQVGYKYRIMERRNGGGRTMEYKYILSIPKPLLNDFVNNRVIPFVGGVFKKCRYSKRINNAGLE